jgi:hypothetical protein
MINYAIYLQSVTEALDPESAEEMAKGINKSVFTV